MKNKLYPFLRRLRSEVKNRPLKASRQTDLRIQPSAYRCHAELAEYLDPLFTLEGQCLPDTLLVSPGTYRVGHVSFALEQEGIYRFYLPGHLSEQRLVCQQGVDSLLQMQGYLWRYGNGDDFASFQEMLEFLKHRPINLTCGYLAELSAYLFEKIQVTSRPVSLLSDQPPNGFDDGHDLLEIEHPQWGWILYDPSFHLLFKCREQYLNLLDFITHMDSQPEEVKFQELPGNKEVGTFRTLQHEFELWVGARLLVPGALKKWYTRLARWPMIAKQGQTFSTHLPSINYVSGDLPTHVYLDFQEFKQKFYGR